MEKIFDLLELLKEKYALLIGGPYIKELATFITGYEFAIERLLGERVRFGMSFLTFVSYREEKGYCDLYWDGILLKNYSEDEAFIKFFEYVEEFKEWIKSPEREEEERAEITIRDVKHFKALWGLEDI